MRDEINTQARAAQRLLQTEFINRPIDIGPALRRAAVERYWLEQMVATDVKCRATVTVLSADDGDQLQGASVL